MQPDGTGDFCIDGRSVTDLDSDRLLGPRCLRPRSRTRLIGLRVAAKASTGRRFPAFDGITRELESKAARTTS